MPVVLTFFPDLATEDQAVRELEIRRRQTRAAVARVSPSMAVGLATLSREYPTLQPGVLVGAAIAGLAPGDPSLKQIANRSLLADIQARRQVEAARQQEGNRPWDQAWSLFKGQVRELTTALDFLYKEGIVGTSSFIVGLTQGLSPGEAAERSYGMSPGAIAIASRLQGRPANLGTGLTYDQQELTPELAEALASVGGMGGLRDMPAEQAQAMLALAQSPAQLEKGLPAWLYGELLRQSQGVRVGARGEEPGRPVTPGRWLADSIGAGARQFGVEILEPGSGAYNVVSGIGDFGSNIFLDPASKLLKLGGALRTANRALVPDAVRPTVLERNAGQWLNSPHGQAVTRAVAEERDYQNIYGLLRHSTSGRRVNATLARDLTNATHPGEVARIMHEAVQVGALERVVAPQSLAGRAITRATGVPVGSVTGTLASPLTGSPRLARLGGVGVGVAASPSGTVLGQWARRVSTNVYENQLDPYNVDSAVENLGSFLRIAQFEHASASRYMHRMASIEQGDIHQAYRIMLDAADEWSTRLVAAGLAPEKVRPIAEIFSEVEELRKYFTNLAGNPEYVPTGRVVYRRSGEIDIQPSAVLFSEMLNRTIPLPDPHKVRSAMRQVRLAETFSPRVAAALMDTKPAEFLRAAAMVGNWTMSQVWKPLVLFRVAYMVRILSEEQLRMGAAGLDSFVHHPVQYMAMLMGRKEGLVDDLVTGVAEHRAAMSSGNTYQALLGESGRRRRTEPFEYITYIKGESPQHLSSWVGELSQLWSDELASAIARSVYPLVDEVPPGAAGGLYGFGPEAAIGPGPRAIGPGAQPEVLPAVPGAPGSSLPRPHAPFVFTHEELLDDVKQRFWDGDLASIRERLIKDHPELRESLGRRDVADAHIEMIWARINSKTGGRYRVFSPRIGGWQDDIGTQINDLAPPPGNRDSYVVLEPGDPDIIRAIGQGRLDDIDLVDADEATYKRIIATLGQENYYRAAPDKVKGPREIERSMMDRWDSLIRTGFHLLIGVETDKLSRSPTWRQFYWRRVGQALPMADEATRNAMLVRAKAAGVPRQQMREWVSRAMEPATDAAFDSLESIDTWAKAFALEETQRLLYDLSRRRDFFQMTRLIFPFGEAWNEIISTWGRMLVEHPEVLRRGTQAIQGARSSGFFYTDPSTNEEVFNYPGSEFLAEHMFEGEVTPQLTGRVAGLNLALGSVLPGFGPVVQLPAASLDWLTKDPDFRWLRDQIFPFAAPDAETPGQMLDSLMPTWFRRAMQALGRPTGTDQRLYNNTVIDVMRAMKLAGQWRDGNKDEYDASMATAKERAKQLFAIRTFSSFAAPTGASVRWDVNLDPDGVAYAYQVLATEYRKLIEANPQNDAAAFDQFVQRFGIDPLVLAEPKSQSIVPRSVTEQGYAFYADNQELFKRFPLTAYFAMPDDPDADFDYGAYLEQFENQIGVGLDSPARVALTPGQWLDQYNRAAGGMIYERAKAAVGDNPNDAQRAWLRMIREQVRDAYPGFGGETIGLGQAVTQDQMIEELYGWSADPFLSQTETGKGLIVYLGARERAIAEAANRGVVGWDVADSTADLRSWLAGVAQFTIMQYPEFAAVFDRVLASEVETVEPVAPASLAGIDLTGGE